MMRKLVEESKDQITQLNDKIKEMEDQNKVLIEKNSTLTIGRYSSNFKLIWVFIKTMLLFNLEIKKQVEGKHKTNQ